MYHIEYKESVLLNPKIRHATRGVVLNEENEILILTYKSMAFLYYRVVDKTVWE